MRYFYWEITRLNRQVMKMKDLIIPAEKFNIQYQPYYRKNKGQFGNFCYSESCTHKTNVINSKQTPAKPWSFTDWATSLTTWKHHNTKRFSIENTVPCVFTYRPHQVKSMKEENFSYESLLKKFHIRNARLRTETAFGAFRSFPKTMAPR